MKVIFTVQSSVLTLRSRNMEKKSNRNTNCTSTAIILGIIKGKEN